MSLQPVNGWDRRLGAVSEATFGTVPTPANNAAYAAYFGEVIAANLGPVEQGATRPKRDRGPGRGTTGGFIEGRVMPIPFSIDLSMRSRSAIDADPRVLEAVLYKAAGLKKTTNASTSVVYAPSATPIESADFASCVLYGFEGQGLATYLQETLRGCLVKTLRWEGGDKEVSVRAAGAGIGKYSSGALDSITLASGAGTTLTHTAAESFRLAPGYYLCESEVILIALVADVGYGSTSTTIARGQLGTSGAAHTAKPMVPYVPTGITFAGTPLAEPVATVSFGGRSIRALNWFLEFTTGLDHLPGETGSKYVQGVKSVRYGLNAGFRLVLHADDVSLLGQAQQRSTAGALAFVLSQGTGTGSVFGCTATYTELLPFAVPDPVNDVSIVDVQLRTRDNAGQDMFSITLT